MDQAVKARIVYWGIEGSGKSANLKAIHGKLRADHRGELKAVPTRLDPTVSYECLPMQLGEVSGVPTEIEVLSVPGAPEQAPTRKQLLDRVHGIVLVLDGQPERADENVAAVAELRESLASYGVSLADLPVVVQYNKRDMADAYQLEELHRRIGIDALAVFEAVASEGTGVLQTLTTISKRVIRRLRDAEAAGEAEPSESEEPAIGKPVPVYGGAADQDEDRPVEIEDAPAIEEFGDDEFESEEREPGDFDDDFATPDDLAPTPDEKPAGPSTTELLEQAILDEGDGAAAGVLPEAPAKPESELRLGPDTRIVSVGSAERTGESEVRLPLVLGNDAGQSASVALTIRIDPLVDDET